MLSACRAVFLHPFSLLIAVFAAGFAHTPAVAQSAARSIAPASPVDAGFALTPLAPQQDDPIQIGYFGDAAFFSELPGDPADPQRSGIIEYATRFTAPERALVDAALFAINGSGLAGTGTLRVYLAEVVEEGEGNFEPGTRLDSVDVPFSALAAGEFNGVSFADAEYVVEAGAEFFFVFRTLDTSADASIQFLIDNGSTNDADVDYFPARSRLYITPPSVDADAEGWYRWQNNNNFLFAAQLVPQAPTSVDDGADLPAAFTLHGAYPNPFNPHATLRFDLRTAEHVTLTVHDAQGRTLAVLHDRPLPAGTHEVAWTPEGLPSGTYFVRLQADGQAQSRPLTLVK